MKTFNVRSLFVCVHRWAGLAMAGFLILVSLTGSLLAFRAELNHWVAPKLYPGPHSGVEMKMAELARQAEALAPLGRAIKVNLGVAGTAIVTMEPRPGIAGVGFDAICLDPVSGRELGRLDRGSLPDSLNSLMNFVYRLHYTLAMGDLGEWILGVVALAWTVDCFIGLYLTLPRPSARVEKRYFERWKSAWLVKTPGSFFRVNFDLHRAAGLWLWGFLFIFAWSSVYMDLNGIYTGVTRLFFDYEQPIRVQADKARPANDLEPIGWEDAQEIGEKLMAAQASEQGFTIERPDALYLLPKKGLVQYRVRGSRDIGEKFGRTSVFFDAYTGLLTRVSLPTGQRAGDTITTWLIELHMADLFGLPYRIFVCGFGFAIVMLSATGVYIWAKKRNARPIHGRIRLVRRAPKR